MSHGVCPGVGIGGHAGLGGFGPSSRKWGLTVDNVIGYDVVLSNSTIVRNLTADKDPDLYWVSPFVASPADWPTYPLLRTARLSKVPLLPLASSLSTTSEPIKHHPPSSFSLTTTPRARSPRHKPRLSSSPSKLSANQMRLPLSGSSLSLDQEEALRLGDCTTGHWISVKR
jgi:hypothetical protein